MRIARQAYTCRQERLPAVDDHLVSGCVVRDKVAVSAIPGEEALSEERHYLKCAGRLQGGRECNVILAARVAGLYFIKKAGFEVVAGEVHSVRCDRCGTTTELPHLPQAEPKVEIGK